MYPKGNRQSIARKSKPKKKRFRGNQYTNKNKYNGQSASAKKLSSANNDDIRPNLNISYQIIEFFTIFSFLGDILQCIKCQNDITFEQSPLRGFGFKLLVNCACGSRKINSGPMIGNAYEINRRIVFVMRILGLGRAAINIFCGLMDIGQGISQNAYELIVQHMYTASSSMFQFVRQKATDEEKEANIKNNRPATDFKVSGDGSWKKRGFSSLFGVTTLIAHYTGKVIDLIVKCGFCNACNMWNGKKDTAEYADWYENHEEQCPANHFGSSGKMEVDSIKEMFGRSLEQLGVRYRNYIGDGDSKIFKGILDLNPYGDRFPVVKNECINHVEKRMGSQLRAIKKQEKLGGRRKLTDGLIKKLTIYFGLAIRRNINSVANMKKAIMATLHHYSSTDTKKMHQNCPTGADSWCAWQKAKAEGTHTKYKHPSPLISPDIKKHLLPIYVNLSRDELLTRCLGGHTQNSNESLNSTVWRMAPKHLHSGGKVINIAAFMAAGVFNEGYFAILKVMEELRINIGVACKDFATNYDAQRITRQNEMTKSCTKEARTARRLENTRINELYEEEEGLLYAPGIAD